MLGAAFLVSELVPILVDFRGDNKAVEFFDCCLSLYHKEYSLRQINLTFVASD